MSPGGTTWYEAAAGDLPRHPPLEGSTQADICIVGGGYTGLSAALHLAEAGRRVVLLEAGRIGDGASGRNGGQLHSGQRRDQRWLERHLGLESAQSFWRMAEEAKALVHGLIARHGIDCDWRPGLIEAVHRARDADSVRAYGEHLRDRYGYGAVSWLDADELAHRIGTRAYHGGLLDRGAGHLDPLKFVAGLARAAAGAGAAIHEGTPVLRLTKRPNAVETARGRVAAATVILAGNGHMSGLDRATDARVMPIVNYVLATQPIGAGRPGGLLAGGEAVSDTRSVVNYWRPTPDGRLLFGGGETYRRRYAADPAPLVRRRLLSIYPGLAGTRVDYAWGGTLAVTMSRMPFIRRLRPGVYVAAGYSGQGVALAPYAGFILAEAIKGDPSRLDRFAALPARPFPGGRWLRWPALVAGMSWYALRDRI